MLPPKAVPRTVRVLPGSWGRQSVLQQVGLATPWKMGEGHWTGQSSEAHSLCGGLEARTQGHRTPPPPRAPRPGGKAACWVWGSGRRWKKGPAGKARLKGPSGRGAWNEAGQRQMLAEGLYLRGLAVGEGRVRVGRGGWGRGASSWGAGRVASSPQAPTLPPSVPLFWAGTLNERSSCLLLDLLAVKKETGMSQTEEIGCHQGLGRGVCWEAGGTRVQIARSKL